MIVPQRLELLEELQPCIRDISSDPETHQNYIVWRQSFTSFNERLRQREAEAVSLGWQRYYFRGTAPHTGDQAIPEASAHRTRLKLRTFAESEDHRIA
jgi:hypothetical protein